MEIATSLELEISMSQIVTWMLSWLLGLFDVTPVNGCIGWTWWTWVVSFYMDAGWHIPRDIKWCRGKNMSLLASTPSDFQMGLSSTRVVTGRSGSLRKTGSRKSSVRLTSRYLWDQDNWIRWSVIRQAGWFQTGHSKAAAKLASVCCCYWWWAAMEESNDCANNVEMFLLLDGWWQLSYLMLCFVVSTLLSRVHTRYLTTCIFQPWISSDTKRQ